MPEATRLWWATLVAVSVINLMAWVAAAWWARRQGGALSPELRAMQRWQLLLSAGYVLGCGYRSWFPVYDVPRQVLVDSWLSSVLVGRSVATVAELCFAAQWALVLRAVSQVHAHAWGLRLSAWVLPLILLAELCSWTAVLTTINLGHVLEESLWALVALMLVCSLVIVWPRSRPEARPYLAAATLAGVAYVLYMVLVDVPMYWARWTADELAGRPVLGLWQGVSDAATRWVVSHRWEDWRGEVLWMSAYFSVAVWISLGLTQVRLPLAQRQATVSG
jgi:hypothetical protein